MLSCAKRSHTWASPAIRSCMVLDEPWRCLGLCRLVNAPLAAPCCPKRGNNPAAGQQSGNESVKVKAIASRAALAVAISGLLALIAEPALAHTVAGSAAGFGAGFLHPLTGFDHLLAMVCVGIWGAELGAPAIWLLPIAFPLIMAFGGALGVVGVPLPAGELLVAFCVVVLGALVAWGRRMPIAAALAVVAVFAVAHGHAHGSELPGAADAVAFT